MAALIYNNLEEAGLINLVPPEIASFLRNASFMSLAQNAGNLAMMGEALDILSEENVKVVLLKGIALELMVFGNRGLRQMSDVDVLLDRNVILKAFRKLEKAGYNPIPVKSVFHRMIMVHYGKHLPSLIKNGFSLELHHELFSQENHHLTEILYNTSLEIEISGRKAWLPEPRILFLYLVWHLNRHEENNDSQIRLYTDLVVMIDRYGDQIINEGLTELADKSGMNSMLATRLWCLHEFWEAEFPVWMIEYIEKWRDAGFVERFIFFLKSPKNNPAPDRSGSYNEIYKAIPGFHRKALYLLGDLFPSVSFMKERYKCNSMLKAILHYPHRWGKVWWLVRGLLR